VCKDITVTGNKEDFALLAKALTATRDGKSLSDRDNIKRTGKFIRRGTLSYELHAEVKEDYEQQKFWGVGLDDLVNMLLAAVPGVVEDHMRDAAAILVEQKRAEMENRPMRDIHVVGSDGENYVIAVSLAEKMIERANKLKSKAAKVAKDFAQEIKTTRQQRGAVQIGTVNLVLHKQSESPSATGALTS
jgi:hypothetical protein